MVSALITSAHLDHLPPPTPPGRGPEVGHGGACDHGYRRSDAVHPPVALAVGVKGSAS